MENLDLEKIIEEEIFRIIHAIITIKCDYNISYKAWVDMIKEYATVNRIGGIIENREDKKIISKQYLDEKTIIEHTVWDNSRERLLLMSQSGHIIKINVEKSFFYG